MAALARALAAQARSSGTGGGSELNTGLGPHALLPEGVAQQPHLGDQVGPLQQRRRRPPTRQGHMGERRAAIQARGRQQ